MTDREHHDPTWPYEDVEGREAIASEPTWECAAGFCVCPGGHETGEAPHRFSVVLCDERARRMPGARCRVLADGILANEDQPYADGAGRIEVEWRRLPERVLVEWAPAATPLEHRYPYRKLHYVDLSALDGEEAARRRLHNLGYSTRPELADNIRDFQRAYRQEATGQLADVEGRLALYNDGQALPPLVTARSGAHETASSGASEYELVSASPSAPAAAPQQAGGAPGGVAAPPPAIPQQDITLEVFVKFEAWDKQAHRFVPLADMTVEAEDLGLLGTSELDTRVTGADGVAHFVTTADKRPAGKAIDLTFRARPAGRVVGGVKFPDEWRTLGWKSTDGSDGVHKHFTQRSLGSAAVPIVFRVGVDFHLKIRYRFTRADAEQTETAAEGIGIWLLHLTGTGQKRLASFRTDAQGEVHDITFAPKPGDFLQFGFDGTIQNGGISLPFTRFALPQGHRPATDMHTISPDFKAERTSIEAQNAPWELVGTEMLAASMYVFKVLSEWSEFLTLITRRAWTGVPELTIFPHAAGGTSYSFPVGHVNLDTEDLFDRPTIAHELSHQIMWKESDVSSGSIVAKTLLGQLHLRHRSNLLSDGMIHPLIEGWADFMDALFNGARRYNVARLRTSFDAPPSVDLGPPPANNRGEFCEGAFANGLLDVYQHFIGGQAIAEGNNGRVALPWINDDVRARWKAAIWEPLQELRNKKPPTTHDFLVRQKTGQQADWFRFAQHLHRWNMMMDPPTITSITPASGQAGVGVVIAGTEFIAGETVVKIDGVLASGAAALVSGERIDLSIPAGPAAELTIVIETKAGSASVRFTRVQ